MKITQSGIYVQVQKYGIEGLISLDSQEKKDLDFICLKISSSNDKDEAQIEFIQNVKN